MTNTDSLFRENNLFQCAVGKDVRECVRGMLVRVYRNLNKPDFFSILALEGPEKGKVVGYAKSVELATAEFKVSAAGRARVLRDSRKCVHAFCEGHITQAANVRQPTTDEAEVTYNPYTAGYFYHKATHEPVADGRYSVLIQQSSVYVKSFTPDLTLI